MAFVHRCEKVKGQKHTERIRELNTLKNLVRGQMTQTLVEVTARNETLTALGTTAKETDQVLILSFGMCGGCSPARLAADFSASFTLQRRLLPRNQSTIRARLPWPPGRQGLPLPQSTHLTLCSKKQTVLMPEKRSRPVPPTDSSCRSLK